MHCRQNLYLLRHWGRWIIIKGRQYKESSKAASNQEHFAPALTRAPFCVSSVLPRQRLRGADVHWTQVEDIPLHPQYIDVNIKTHSCNSKRPSTIHSILFPMPENAFCSLDFNDSVLKTVFIIFWPHHVARGIFIPKPRIELVSAAGKCRILTIGLSERSLITPFFKESECGYISLLKNIEWKSLNGN